MQITAEPKTGAVIEALGFSRDGWLATAQGARVDIVNNNGALQWRLNYYDNGWKSVTVGSVDPNTWYSVEISLVLGKGSGETHLYVNGADLASETGLTNTALGSSVKYFSLGIVDEYGGNTLAINYDSVVLAQGYIGQDAATTLQTTQLTTTETATPELTTGTTILWPRIVQLFSWY